jgi:hypothetical protein
MWGLGSREKGVEATVAYFEEGLLPEIRVESLKTKEDIFE